ncbi:MAG: MBL fold metallo-hydrolase, partial [Halobacteriota archaeon]
PTLSMTAIDVGRGDALLVTYPNGQHMLVDGGTGYAARAYVIPYLIQHKITRLDAIVSTHEHDDHLDGLVEVLKDGRFSVGTAYPPIFR